LITLVYSKSRTLRKQGDATVNSVQLVGRLTGDPEIKGASPEAVFAVLRLAIARRRDDADALFIDVVCFGRQAVAAGAYLTKGRLVAVTGHLEYREWTGADRLRRSRHQVVAESIDYLPGDVREHDDRPPTADGTEG
jgi:single-strand DNA-binding protein